MVAGGGQRRNGEGGNKCNGNGNNTGNGGGNDVAGNEVGNVEGDKGYCHQCPCCRCHPPRLRCHSSHHHCCCCHHSHPTPLPSVQPLQRLSPLSISSTLQSNDNGMVDGNGSNGYGDKPLQQLSPLPTSLTLQSTGNGVGDDDGSDGYGGKGGG
jgi:hypothetical protein